MKKSFILLSIICSLTLNSFAQENADINELKLSATLQSMFYWRGAPLSYFSNSENTPSPVLTGEISYTINKKFTLGAWTGQSFESNGYKNASYYISYNFGSFNISLWDVYTFSGPKNKDFFNFTNEETQHFIDLSFGYNFDSVPLSLFWATVIYGRDGKVVDGAYKNAYSSYFKVNYKILDVKDISVNLYSSVGGVLNDLGTENSTYSFYGTPDAKESSGVTEVGITGNKKIKVTESFAFSISMGVVASPLNKRFDGFVAFNF